jgi:hypothetical protein
MEKPESPTLNPPGALAAVGEKQLRPSGNVRSRSLLCPRAQHNAHQLSDGAGSPRVHGPGRCIRRRKPIVGNESHRRRLQTGKIAWRKELNGGSVGLLSTAGGLLFLSNPPNVEAWDAKTGKGLWYSQIGGLASPPETFKLDGKQHFLFNAGTSVYLFVLN